MEFIVDEKKNIYFMEVNTRLQVEHPVTECVTGVDLVRAQIEVASKGSIPWKQKEIVQKGCAIECRICAEDTLNNFPPSPGKITYIRQPGGTGIREDSGIYQGWEISPFYDSLLVKVTAFAHAWDLARHRMDRALREFRIRGLKTNIPFLENVINNPIFAEGGPRPPW
jgi:acetyl-CoA carboxylase biotin carboxylase subunit